MKKPAKAVKALRKANPHTQPRPVPYTGTGEWLYWHAPNGSREMIGIVITLGGIRYHQICAGADIYPAAAALWGDTVARQLGKTLDITAAAASAGSPLPATISAEPIPIVNADTPGELLDLLWQYGPAQSLLLKKKPPSVKAERSIEVVSNPVAEPAAKESHTHAPAAQAGPESTGE